MKGVKWPLRFGGLVQCAVAGLRYVTYLAQVIVLPFALLDEIGEFRRQKLGRHICIVNKKRRLFTAALQSGRESRGSELRLVLTRAFGVRCLE